MSVFILDLQQSHLIRVWVFGFCLLYLCCCIVFFVC